MHENQIKINALPWIKNGVGVLKKKPCSIHVYRFLSRDYEPVLRTVGHNEKTSKHFSDNIC